MPGVPERGIANPPSPRRKAAIPSVWGSYIGRIGRIVPGSSRRGSSVMRPGNANKSDRTTEAPQLNAWIAAPLG